jgi:hypothetical protein
VNARVVGLKVLKGLGWLVTGCALLALLAYAWLLWLNRKDEPPSAAYLQLVERAKPKVPDAENGFFILAGMDAPPGADVHSHGVSVWKKAIEPITPAPPTADSNNNVESDRTKYWRTLPQWTMAENQCPYSLQACTETEEKRSATQAKLTAYAPRFERIDAFMAMPRCEEQTHFQAFSLSFSAHQEFVAMITAAWEARQSQSDPKVWTNALERTFSLHEKLDDCGRTLVSTMLGVARASTLSKFLSDWVDVIPSDDVILNERFGARLLRFERSLQPSLVRSIEGEFASGETVMDSIKGTMSVFHLPTTEPDWIEQISNSISAPLWQPQATRNRFARDALDRADLYRAEAPNLESVISSHQARVVDATQTQFILSLFTQPNPIGRVISDIALPAYSDYALRTHDAIARVRLVRVKLAALANTNKPENPALALGEGGYNPYTNAPFDWNAQTRTLSFTPKDKPNNNPLRSWSSVKVGT